MSAQTLLTSLFQYKAWADEGLFSGLNALSANIPADERRVAILILNHAHIVDRIFASNLQRREHAYTRTGADEAPAFEELYNAVRETDRWYVDYVAELSAEDLTESIAFKFSDGGYGRMSRQEMLGHVIAHGGYHRGEVGQIITQLTGSSPPDTFTGYLHTIEPVRREPAWG
ncbi:DinB family protein [Rhizobium sp. CB3090]|uniref:DinB family protein n=1 Tax=Rhizobium sp. CB3090 TaxID=3039156 RepID=UPI0024B1683B|nr:DinB family protein [Rhizobium sp. CB3090]WFU08469.1 DinB family protein [Rhizobium sp. CB3090]